MLGWKTIFAAAVVALAVLYGFSLRAMPPPVVLSELPGSVASSVLQEPTPPQEPVELSYIEVTDGCSPYFGGACVNVRSGPGTEHAAVWKLRSGVVLQTSERVEAEDRTWYKLAFDNEWLRYPERAQGDLYVAGDFVTAFTHTGPEELAEGESRPTAKRIVVDRSEQKLYAYDGEQLVMEEPVSTGLELTPTPRGNFVIFKKTPSRYMQGPIEGISEDEYDLPGVPWNLYFTHQGGAIHGAYWHDRFGEQWSHGCVNLPLTKAYELYEWAELGTPVLVRD